MDSPAFVWLLSHSSWFCLASTTRLRQIRERSGTSDFILTFVQEQFAWILLVLCDSFPIAPGFVWLPQLT